MNSINNTGSVNYKHDELVHNFSAAQQILPFLLKKKQINSVLDIGCGIGTWLAVAHELGVNEILGIDGVNLNKDELKIPADNFINYDLTLPINLNRKFDLVICLEVAEHLPEKSAKTIIDTITHHTDFIIFSAAIPGQGGQNHLNEQWPAYWQQIFEDKGYYPCELLQDFFWDNDKVEWWYKQNIFIYAPKSTLATLNLSVGKAKSIVHPELFNEKLQLIEKLETTIDTEIWNPSLKTAFKRFIKSIIK